METNQNKKTEENLICSYLKGDLTPEETRDLIDWIKLDKANKQTFDEYCELWITTRSISKNPGYNAQEGFWKFRQRIRKSDQQVTIPLKVRFLRTAVRYAAIFIIAFSAGGFLFYQFGQRFSSMPAQGKSELVIPLGSRANFTLSDGTVVTLNAGSTLKTDNRFGIKDRVVELEGEGYFKVSKDARRPFIVSTSCINVIALGTEFNVKAYSVDNTVETTLVNGSIKVEPVLNNNKSEILVLKPNQMLTFYKEESKFVDESDKAGEKIKADSLPLKVQKAIPFQRLVTENVNIEPVVSWKENRWIFDQQSLSQIAVELERKFDVQINFESERLKAFRFTGTIIAEPIEQVLEVMSISAPLNFRLKGRVVTLSENKHFEELNKSLYNKHN